MCRDIAVKFGEGEIHYYSAPLVLRDGEAGLDFSKLQASPNPHDPPVYRGKFFVLKMNHVCKVCLHRLMHGSNLLLHTGDS